MKAEFPQYFRPPRARLDKLWQEGVFVFDTNVLLNSYRWKDSLRSNFFKILETLKERLWLPHQVASEYLRNRPKVILDELHKYENIQRFLDEIRKQADTEFKKYERHPFIDTDHLKVALHRVIDDVKKRLEEQKKSHPQLIPEDPHQNFLAALYEGKTGQPFSQKDLEAIYKEGKSRYEQKIPPGYMDEGKVDGQRYGDLIIWKQILDYASTSKRDIAFISDDDKEDWIWREKGKTLGARPELINEMQRTSGNWLFIYNSPHFIELASQHLGINTPAGDVEDARRTVQERNVPDEGGSLSVLERLQAWGAGVRQGREQAIAEFFGSSEDSTTRGKLLSAIASSPKPWQLPEFKVLSEEEKKRVYRLRALDEIASNPELILSRLGGSPPGSSSESQVDPSELFGPADAVDESESQGLVFTDSIVEPGTQDFGEPEAVNPQEKSSAAEPSGRGRKRPKKKKHS